MEPLDALQRINTHHGRGEIVRVVPDDNGGTAIIHYGWVGKGQKPFEENRRFTIKGNKIRFRGVTRNIGYSIK
jgi:hypothetical protein